MRVSKSRPQAVHLMGGDGGFCKVRRYSLIDSLPHCCLSSLKNGHMKGSVSMLVLFKF